MRKIWAVIRREFVERASAAGFGLFATEAVLASTHRDILIGMIFSNVVMYFIMLATGATLHKAGQTSIQSAADAAVALQPLADIARFGAKKEPRRRTAGLKQQEKQRNASSLTGGADACQ